MKKKHLVHILLVILAVYFLAIFQLPYYIYKPGSADALNPIVEVEEGYSSKGDMHLVTVSGAQATPMQFLLAKILPHHDVLPIDEVFPEGITDNEYMHVQLQMMENSQEASTVVAYQAADKQISIDYNGVYVAMVVENMPAEGKLEMGDRIIEIDDKKITQADDLLDYIETKRAGDTILVKFVRDDETMTESITLKELKDLDNKPGIGIQLVTDRAVSVNPEVKFSSGQIGGPSAGLMFSLEIYDQLTKEDITKGYEIAGTGEIDYDGNVYRIGGIDKKVVAADKEGVDIFFAPNEQGKKGSNYQVALEKAKEIETDMKIVPVDTFEDAITYLEELK
ncbi:MULTISPECIES: SepM family pheromone-processing serine protease [Clostridia]|uniref:SepM family pheromone-processing serine protease n=1 Tax=Clostridia TaxID=186801 RepID=UPI000EA00E4D|nr:MULTISPECIES: SepM family pheromone-processing serine protease [Clostridia]NBJ68508.1 PDZ domain-containing protein [Roseburia sp. 1XD42-34]RKI81264.1 PDZ domain-containing protein [Clostridium sp. 1xD42-85]